MLSKCTALVVLLTVLAGCADPPAAAEPQPAAPAQVTTELASTTALVASAVAKSRPQLDAAMDRYDADGCIVHMAKDKVTRSVTKCQDSLTKIGQLSRIMLKDLGDAKPWPAEVSDLADETSLRLETMSEASNWGDGKPAAQISEAIQYLRPQLQAWKPFGA